MLIVSIVLHRKWRKAKEISQSVEGQNIRYGERIVLPKWYQERHDG